MDEFSVETFVEIHDELISEDDGQPGILNLGNLEYIVYELNRTNKVFKKAALVLHGIATRHPFIDGNKRTSLTAAYLILMRDGYKINASENEKLAFMIEVAKYNIDVKEVEKWLRENSITV